MAEATKTDFSKLNVYQKLAHVRQKAPYIQKSKRGQQYSYVGSSDVLAALNAVINQVGLILKPEIVAHQVRESHDEVWKADKVKKEPVPKKRTTYFTELELVMTWVNIDNPSEIVACSWYSQGVDIEGEKGVGKALTYAEKYFLLKFFNIATDDDDPDKYQKEQLKNTAITERQIDTLNALISRVSELAGQEFEAVKSLAINDSDLNLKKPFEEYSAYDYGVISKLLAKWTNFYESRQKVQGEKK